jgi:hypothetical protein
MNCSGAHVTGCYLGESAEGLVPHAPKDPSAKTASRGIASAPRVGEGPGERCPRLRGINSAPPRSMGARRCRSPRSGGRATTCEQNDSLGKPRALVTAREPPGLWSAHEYIQDHKWWLPARSGTVRVAIATVCTGNARRLTHKSQASREERRGEEWKRWSCLPGLGLTGSRYSRR